MASMTNFLANKLRDHSLGIVAWTMPTNVYLAVFTTATTAAGGGTEATGGSYARQQVAWTTGAVGAASSTADEVFTNMPAGTFTHAAIMDALTTGNMLWHGPLSASKTLTAGDSLRLPAGSITVTLA